MLPAPATSDKRSNAGRTPQLSCELCRERKVKCDKLDPCTNCRNARVLCAPIYRMRLPRGRHASQAKQQRIVNPARPSQEPRIHGSEKTQDIGRQVRRLERMVTDLSALDGSSSLDPLVNEIRALRNIVDAAQEGARSIENKPIVLASSFTPPLRLSSVRDPDPLFLENCTGFSRNEMTRELCHIYLRQVDPVVKILHRPSVTDWIVLGNRYLHYPENQDHPSLNALGLAVCYTAAVSLTEAQSHSLFQMDKGSLVKQYRLQCEAAIDKAGLLTTEDITVLQAFVLYLIGRRTEDPTRAVWTLIAVAVRVAKSLCLDINGSHQQTFFDQQMRKRLWLTICLMDLQASFSEGSMPLISPEEVASSLPLLRNINDADFNWSTIDDVPHKEGLTDTTFSLVTYHAQLGGRIAKPVHDGRKSIEGDSTFGFSSTAQSDWTSWTPDSATRQRRAKDFEKKALDLLHFCDPESSPYAWFTWHGTQCLVSATRLLAMYPFLRPDSRSQNQQSGSPPPRPSTRELQQFKTDVLHLALNVLDKAGMMQADPRSEGFRWYITVPWHAFAVALVECYTCRDKGLLRRAYPLLESAYSHCVKLALQERSKNSLHKMMMRARVRIQSVLHEDAANNTTSSLTAMTDQIAPNTPDVAANDYDGRQLHIPKQMLQSIVSLPTTQGIPAPSPYSTSLGVDNLSAHPSPSLGTNTGRITQSSPPFESTSELPSLEWDNALFATGVDKPVGMPENDSDYIPVPPFSGYPDVLDLWDEVFSDLPFGTLTHPNMI